MHTVGTVPRTGLPKRFVAPHSSQLIFEDILYVIVLQGSKLIYLFGTNLFRLVKVWHFHIAQFSLMPSYSNGLIIHGKKQNNKILSVSIKYIRRMSHLISGLNIPSQPLFDKCQLKKVVAPHYKHLLKQIDRKHKKKNDSWREEVAISILCKKLSEKEYLLLRKQNASQIQHHFSKLKQKIRKNLQPNALSVGRFFENLKQDNTLDVKRVLESMPRSINLTNKYNHKLINYAQSINNARKISSQKQNYLKWLDRSNNNSIKSPNYCRMSYVLERLQSCDNRLLHSPNIENKKSDNCIITKMKNTDYKPSSKKTKTMENQLTLLHRCID